MKYSVQWQKKATKQLMKLEHSSQTRIMDAVGRLSDSKTWSNVKPLVNYICSHRLRVGDFRVLFDADVSVGSMDEIRILDIVDVRKRDSQTY